MHDEHAETGDERLTLQRAIDPDIDHVRGDSEKASMSVVLYGDYLCPYCRRLRTVLAQLRDRLGDELIYVFRHFPNEHAHPGADYLSRAAEAAGAQGRFWEMHDWLYAHELPISHEDVSGFVEELGLDIGQFERDVESQATHDHVQADIADGREHGVTGTPTLFADGVRYDDAWDVDSLTEALQRPMAAQVQRSARVFANLPASGGLLLLLAALAAMICANSPLADWYALIMESFFNIGPTGSQVSMSIGEWFSEGLLSVFFLLVGLEIRREITSGALTDPKAAILPIVAAFGGVLAPAGIYLALNSGTALPGWSIPTATDVAFTLGILALLGNRVPIALRVFVATLAVIDDILSMITLAVFYAHQFSLIWLAASGIPVLGLLALNRARVYVVWPYVLVTCALWVTLHVAGVHAALAGVVLAIFLPTRPAPAAGPLLAQAATALAALEQAEKHVGDASSRRSVREAPIWEWASRNLSAASARLLSPADRIARAVAPWSAYVILPLFAFSATGVSLDVDLGSADALHIVLGIVMGLVLGKPIGILLVSGLAIRSGLAVAPAGVTLRSFVGAACLCGVGDTVALLMTDQAFPAGETAAIAKIAVLTGSTLAAILGVIVLMAKSGEESPTANNPSEAALDAR